MRPLRLGGAVTIRKSPSFLKPILPTITTTILNSIRYLSMSTTDFPTKEEKLQRSRTYNDAINALNSLQSNFAILDAIRKSGGKSNSQAIPEMIEWLRRVGYKPSDLNKVNIIHVAGTKGKGSTCAFTSSILSQYQSSLAPPYLFPTKLGMYTSPHLRAVRERIQINNTPIPEPLFAKYFFEVWDRLELSAIKEARDPTIKPVYFRFLTLMAFHVFLSEGVDTAIVEVGIGGEYDSTNIIEKPTVTGITALGIDHVGLLGDTVESIAWHKAGIIKPGAIVFTVPQPEGALQVIKNRAAEKGTELRIVKSNIEKLELGLKGEFQKMNASLAVELAIEHLKKMGIINQGEELQCLSPQVKAGLERVVWPGRCDVRLDKKGAEWAIDGAHTKESLETTSTWFLGKLSQDRDSMTSPSTCRRILIFNQQTRDASKLIEVVYHIMSTENQGFDHVIFCTNKTWKNAGYKVDLVSINTNSTSVDELQVQRALVETWRSLDSAAETHLTKTIEEAVQLVREIQCGEKVIVFATGSLHLVGGLLEVLEQECGI